jgi:hypothetical protein
MKKYVSLLLFTGFSQNVFSDVCDKWFEKLRLKPGPDCLAECVIADVGMASASCPQGCARYCRENLAVNFIFNSSELYPGLTVMERALVSKDPVAAAKVYKAKWMAEQATLGLLQRNLPNDESDACRHFIWAALMVDALGEQKAKEFLSAHEQTEAEPAEEKSMDVFNNAEGVAAARDMKAKGSFNLENLKKEALAKLRNNGLKVNHKRGLPRAH